MKKYIKRYEIITIRIEIGFSGQEYGKDYNFYRLPPIEVFNEIYILTYTWTVNIRAGYNETVQEE